MSNPRFLSAHLHFPRRALYRARRDEALRSCGSRTEVLLRRDAASPMGAVVLLDPGASHPEDSGYITVAGNVTHHLRLGCNTVGRQLDNDVVIADSTLHVSRRHCSIVIHSDGRAELFDLASLNGTFLNGSRVFERAALHGNDLIRLGTQVAFSVVLYNPLGN
jgi:hypothetical protein